MLKQLLIRILKSLIDDQDKPYPGIKQRGRKSKYPFATMKIRDSVFIEGPISIISSASAKMGRRRNRKFRCRTVEENGIKGTRVWRIA